MEMSKTKKMMREAKKANSRSKSLSSTDFPLGERYGETISVMPSAFLKFWSLIRIFGDAT